jgi:hypothetical protein
MAFGCCSGDQSLVDGKLGQLPLGTKAKTPWRQRLIPISTMARIMLGICIVQSLAAMILEICIVVFHLEQVNNAYNTHRMVNGQDDMGKTMTEHMNQSKSVLVYHYIFIVAQAFQVAMVWTGVS